MISVCMRCEREGGTERAAEERERYYYNMLCDIFFVVFLSFIILLHTQTSSAAFNIFSQCVSRLLHSSSKNLAWFDRIWEHLQVKT